ncbi:hypothetical protein [Kribbella sp. NPDC051770]|uniref:hypothetical protein n=1 Tax=Kribbella sp. NPDC051770 TaxID=3155413 RepID=UPI0034168C6B
MTSRRSTALLAAALLACSLTLVTAASAQAADSPTPSIGATASPGANPPGSADDDTSDWTGTKWLYLGLLVPFLFTGGVILAKRRSRRASDHSPNPPSPRVN